MTDPHIAIDRAMILAAGLGTRLRPLSDRLAKPLLPVPVRPLLEHNIARLGRIGVRDLAINTHHLADQVAALVESLIEGPDASDRCPRIMIHHEPEILGTGGALWNARDFLAQGDLFILYNGDVLSDLDLRELTQDHLRNGPLATLAMADWAPVNSVLVDPAGVVRDIGGKLGCGDGAAGDRLTYTGIAVLSRELLDMLPAGPSSLVDTLLEAMRGRPGSVRGHRQPECYWNDLGTLERYLDALEELLVEPRRVLSDLKIVPEQDKHTGASILMDEHVDLPPDTRWQGFVLLGRGVAISEDVYLENSVLLPGATVPCGLSLRRAVVGPGWLVVEKGNELIRHAVLRRTSWDADLELQPLIDHGSDREFWRLRRDEDTVILMQASADDPEFERYIAVGRFLHGLDLGGPEILASDPAERTVLLEDLGGESLEVLAKAATRGGSASSPELTAGYRKVVDLLVDLQTRGTSRLEICPLAGDRLFDYDTLRWEADYFRQRFLIEWKGLDPQECAELDDEFHALAEAVLQQPVVLMHRDFQSQNIFFKNGHVRLVDFQGARRGPLAYDLMSLLRDSYVDLGMKLREELLEYYRAGLATAGGPGLAREELECMTIAAGLQRNMQALGAFAFLSRAKGKRQFEDHVPLGLRHLAEGLRQLRESEAAPGPMVRLETVVDKLRENR